MWDLCQSPFDMFSILWRATLIWFQCQIGCQACFNGGWPYFWFAAAVYLPNVNTHTLIHMHAFDHRLSALFLISLLSGRSELNTNRPLCVCMQVPFPVTRSFLTTHRHTHTHTHTHCHRALLSITLQMSQE